jgi:hypothetical protein
MIALKPHPDLLSNITIRDTLKLKKQKTQKENSSCSAICVVPIFLILQVLGTGFKHNEGSILTNLSDKSINPLEMCGHTNVPIGIIGPIKKQRFAETTLHIVFVDHRLIKVE